MNVSVTCSNVDCGLGIQVPEGSNQTVCPHCNTWQLVSTAGPGPGSDIFDDVDDDLESEIIPSSADPELGHVLVADEPDPILPPPPVRPSMDGAGETEDSEDAVGHLLTESGVQLPLQLGENSIGRSGADLTLHDLSVSRLHCYIHLTEHGQGVKAEIYDVGFKGEKPSTNGVFIEGRSLRLDPRERVRLRHGAKITLGRVVMTVQLKG